MQIADIQSDIDHELVSKDQIDAKIKSVAKQVSIDYADNPPLLVAVLKGAVNTLTAFSQALSIPVQM
ncbi:MAG: hypoxanthine phosphoribosyltransferase, partial [Bifidobacterium crudilactis]|nr:hypoxanthine phosphoribosyltransferase [Bifidobacterium crudilactis]